MVGRAREVDCFFTVMSPWAYIGHAAFVDIRRRHGLAVRYRPVSLSTVFPESGGLPLARRHPARQAYRMLDLQRWRDASDSQCGLQFRIPLAFAV